jgi:hypothetical protein
VGWIVPVRTRLGIEGLCHSQRSTEKQREEIIERQKLLGEHGISQEYEVHQIYYSPLDSGTELFPARIRKSFTVESEITFSAQFNRIHGVLTAMMIPSMYGNLLGIEVHDDPVHVW